MANLTCLRPLGETHICDELGRDPAHLLELRRGGERARRAFPLRQETLQPAELRVAETGADAARVLQRVAVVVAENQRAERVGSRTLPGKPAPDDELLRRVVLDLAPRGRAEPGLVGAVEPFRDDTLETESLRRLEEVRAATLVCGRRLP